MTIAVFKPGGDIWGKLSQKVIDMAELPAHVAEGWFDSAKDALDASDLAKMEKDNAALAATIADEQVKLDGRTKAARELRAKNAPVTDQGNADAASVAEQATVAAPQSSTQTEAPTESAASAQPDVSAPDAPVQS